MKKYLIGFLLFGCSVSNVEIQDTQVCEIKCSSNFTDIIEVGFNKNAAQYENGYYILAFDSILLKKPSHFTIIAEASRPYPEYSYNGEYWVTSKISSNLEVFANGITVEVGEWKSRMDFRNTHNAFYGNNGYPEDNKLATRVIIGPIYEFMDKEEYSFDIYMKTDFEFGGVSYDTIKVKLKIM